MDISPIEVDKSQLATIIDIDETCITFDVALSSRTWLHRGGIVHWYFKPKNDKDLQNITSYLYANNLPFDVIGHSSNLYIKDSYHPLAIIDTRLLKHFELHGDEILCDAGVPMAALSRFCIEREIAGYEGFIGLPGTVGGAVVNNSGCYGSLTSDLLLRIDLITPPMGMFVQ